MTSEAIRPFRIAVPDADLADLRDRLARTRWPARETVEDWSQGVPLRYLQDLCRYWAQEYDWRAREARLNMLPQFRAEVLGLGVHFVHARSPHANALPLVLSHGWGGSIVEFLKVIGPLADPVAYGGSADDAFHVVVPALPGYGFSDKPTVAGWGTARTADAWAELMGALGYHRYGAQGGDWGGVVTECLGQRHAGSVVGIHLTMPTALPEDATGEREAAALAWMTYQRTDMRRTRPQTQGYGFVDSPVSLCARLVETLAGCMDCDGDPLNVLSRDELLDNVMLYWLPASGASAALIYWETAGDINLEPVSVPVGCSVFRKEVFKPARAWAEKRYLDLRSWSELGCGGHFPAFEQPELLVAEIRSFFRPLRS